MLSRMLRLDQRFTLSLLHCRLKLGDPFSKRVYLRVNPQQFVIAVFEQGVLLCDFRAQTVDFKPKILFGRERCRFALLEGFNLLFAFRLPSCQLCLRLPAHSLDFASRRCFCLLASDLRLIDALDQPTYLRLKSANLVVTGFEEG